MKLVVGHAVAQTLSHQITLTPSTACWTNAAMTWCAIVKMATQAIGVKYALKIISDIQKLLAALANHVTVAITLT